VKRRAAGKTNNLQAYAYHQERLPPSKIRQQVEEPTRQKFSNLYL
jgi:hypothetical protein